MAVIRADLAGKELARALLQRPQGSRPVTLVGYSMGARVIFSCLCELFRIRYEEVLKNEEGISTNEESRSKSMFSWFKSSNKTSDRLRSSSTAAPSTNPLTSSDINSKSTENINNPSIDESLKDDRDMSIEETADPKSKFDLDDSRYDDTYEADYYDPVSVSDSNYLGNTSNLVDEKIRGIESIIQDVVLLGAPVRYKVRVIH